MALSTDLERLSYNSDDGCAVVGLHTDVIASGAATRTLTAAESGATFLFDTATGVVYTLPAPVVGRTFEFFASVAVTSNSYKIITNSASVFLVGNVLVDGGTTETVVNSPFNGTTHVACTMNGTTTGGKIGTLIRVKAISTTQWAITGIAVGSGTVATPAATS